MKRLLLPLVAVMALASANALTLQKPCYVYAELNVEYGIVSVANIALPTLAPLVEYTSTEGDGGVITYKANVPVVWSTSAPTGDFARTDWFAFSSAVSPATNGTACGLDLKARVIVKVTPTIAVPAKHLPDQYSGTITVNITPEG